MPARPNAASQTNHSSQAVRPGSFKADASLYSFRFVLFWNEVELLKQSERSRNEYLRLMHRTLTQCRRLLEQSGTPEAQRKGLQRRRLPQRSETEKRLRSALQGYGEAAGNCIMRSQ